jgi:hypothetical protein
MEPEDSLQFSQKLATGPYSEPDESKPHPKPYFHKIHFNIILVSMPRFSAMVSSLSTFQPKFFEHFSSPPCARHAPSHLAVLDLIKIIFGKKNKLWTSSLCNFLQPPVTSSIFGPHILLSTLFSNTLICGLPFPWEIMLHTHTTHHVKL